MVIKVKFAILKNCGVKLTDRFTNYYRKKSKMKINKLISIGVLGIALLSSCVSNKKFILLQNAKTSTNLDSTRSDYHLNRTIYKLQPNDVVFINLTSQDESVTKAFSRSSSSNNQMIQPANGVGNSFYFVGYSLDLNGEVNLPIIGKVKISGLSINEAKDKLEVEISKYFKVFHLVVQMTEMPFTVLGEVSRPGRYSGLSNQVSILEAIALCGDLTPLANRKIVTLIRQNLEGVKIYKIDLTQADIINTPYFLLRPNDVIYIEPLKSRSIGNFSNFQNSLSTITPLLTTLVLALNTYLIIKK
jgi:polysaccharide export outer membrane protein